MRNRSNHNLVFVSYTSYDKKFDNFETAYLKVYLKSIISALKRAEERL